jgi:hypothetical protein
MDTETLNPAAMDRDAAFVALEETLRASGPEAALERLIGLLTERGEFRALLDALLLKARHDLGLPLIQIGPLGELPEPLRSRYEDRYIEAIRSVGHRLLSAGDLLGAWPYFRAIAEKEPIAQALEAYQPAEGDERIGAVVDVAFNQGANPRRGFELILEHYGVCSALSSFEHLPPDEAIRTACADQLVRTLHEHLTANLRGDIARHGQPLPPEGTSIPTLIAGRDWLFFDDAYHIDLSHLAATVRLAPMLSDPATIALAVELTDYGRRLSDRYRSEGEPPFERLYEDHAVYLRALLGQEVEAAIAHFRGKLPAARAVGDGPLDPSASLPAQMLVRLLVRLDRLEEAIDVAAAHLTHLPESALIGPSLAQLCQRAGRPDRLARAARAHGDLVHYTAAILQTGPLSAP